MSRFDSKESIARKKKLQEEIERIRNSHGTCSSYSPRNVNPFEPIHGTCAVTNINTCGSFSTFNSPSVSSVSKSENMFNQLAAENKKLTQEKIKLNLKVLELQKQLKQAIDDKNKFKAFAEAEKGKVWKDLIKNIKEVFNNIINWFNS